MVNDVVAVMANCEAVILREIADARMTRRDVAQTYWHAIKAHRYGEVIDWAKVNQAILDRWSRHALDWIKKQAWSGKCFR